jgi:hypothetical protein
VDDTQEPFDDSLPPPPPFRPWVGSGVEQPGADRPRHAPEVVPPSADLLPTRALSGPAAVRRYPADAYAVRREGSVPAPVRPATVAVPAARVVSSPPNASVWAARGSAGARVGRDRLIIGSAVLAALAGWMPWIRTPSSSFLSISSGAGFLQVVDTWDVPARYLWSYGGVAGGIELGWIVVGLAVLAVVGCLRDWSRGTLRTFAGLEAATALLFMGQTFRYVHSSPGRAPFGALDYLGFGPFVLLIASFGLSLVPRR